MHEHESQTEDALLVLQLREGNKAAFSTIYERYWDSLYNDSYKRLQDHERVADVIQDIFADLWERRGEAEIFNLRAYLFQAARFQVYKALRKGKSDQVFYDQLTTLRTSANADSGLLGKELQELYQKWLTGLPEKRKQIFKMRYEQEKNTSEIASALNISQKTVQNQLLTATNDLQVKIVLGTSLLLAFIYG